MARVQAYHSIDMLDFRRTIGEAIYADENALVIETSDGQTYYFGDFDYPDGDWIGTIRKIQSYDPFGDIIFEASGFEISTRYATVGSSPRAAMTKVLSGADLIFGSPEADRLAGFGANDVIRAGGGNDRVFGQRGYDDLNGGAGHDALYGGAGNDVLRGGSGNDRLRGDGVRDTFVVGGRNGEDVIVDFTDRIDKILVESGAERFGDLEISARGDGALVQFAGTELLLLDFDIADLARGDFIFL